MYAYVAAGIVLLAVLALRAPAVEAWLWRSLALLMPLSVSLRSALVYAVLFGAASLVVVFL